MSVDTPLAQPEQPNCWPPDQCTAAPVGSAAAALQARVQSACCPGDHTAAYACHLPLADHSGERADADGFLSSACSPKRGTPALPTDSWPGSSASFGEDLPPSLRQHSGSSGSSSVSTGTSYVPSMCSGLPDPALGCAASNSLQPHSNDPAAAAAVMKTQAAAPAWASAAAAEFNTSPSLTSLHSMLSGQTQVQLAAAAAGGGPPMQFHTDTLHGALEAEFGGLCHDGRPMGLSSDLSRNSAPGDLTLASLEQHQGQDTLLSARGLSSSTWHQALHPRGGRLSSLSLPHGSSGAGDTCEMPWQPVAQALGLAGLETLGFGGVSAAELPVPCWELGLHSTPPGAPISSGGDCSWLGTASTGLGGGGLSVASAPYGQPLRPRPRLGGSRSVELNAASWPPQPSDYASTGGGNLDGGRRPRAISLPERSEAGTSPTAATMSVPARRRHRRPARTSRQATQQSPTEDEDHCPSSADSDNSWQPGPRRCDGGGTGAVSGEGSKRAASAPDCPAGDRPKVGRPRKYDLSKADLESGSSKGYKKGARRASYSTRAEALARRRERNRASALEAYYRSKARRAELEAMLRALREEDAALRTVAAAAEAEEDTGAWVRPLLESGVSAVEVQRRLRMGQGAEAPQTG